MRRKVVLQPPIQISASYTQSDREAVDTTGFTKAEVWVEVYQNSAGAGVDVAFLAATVTPSAPYPSPSGIGFLMPTGAKATVSAGATGTQQPFTVTHLASLMKVSTTGPSSGTFTFSVTVYLSDE